MPAIQNPKSKIQNPALTIGWAVFLGMSWTWCIGMYLPVLMVRDFGFWGWVVFAVPNVLGAAAMGWVLRNVRSSTRITSDHSVACAAFSSVTVLFQIMFVSGVVRVLIGNSAGTLLLAGALATILLSRLFRRGDVVAAVLVFAISLAAWHMAIGAAREARLSGFVSPLVHPSAERLRNLAMLAPVVVFGFLLCPYLDLTFHRARQATAPLAGVVAFGLGFFGPFLTMIVFTLWYAPLLESHQRTIALPENVRWAIGLHMSLQCAFTVAVHAREFLFRESLEGEMGGDSADESRDRERQESIEVDSGRSGPGNIDGRILAGIVLGLAASLLPHVAATMAEKAGYEERDHGERVYRLFMAFYGLVFPAYVWLCVLPTRARMARPTRKKVRIFAAVVLAAAPMYWKGFIDNQMIWLLPGLGVVLLSRLFLWEDKPAIE